MFGLGHVESEKPMVHLWGTEILFSVEECILN